MKTNRNPINPIQEVKERSGPCAFSLLGNVLHQMSFKEQTYIISSVSDHEITHEIILQSRGNCLN